MSGKMAFVLIVVFWGMAAIGVGAEEETIFVEQDYNMFEMGKEGPSAKDIRQKIYISRDWMCIDEFGGQDRGKPSEGFMIDFKGKQIIQLDYQDKKKVTESFEARRKRIEKRVKETKDDYNDQPPGPIKDKLYKLNRAMLDDNTRFAIAADPSGAHSVLGVDCNPIKVIDADAPDYVPFEAQMHPTLELPYDNADALYLMRIMGKGLSEFIKANKDKFKYMPMELHLELAAGGHLDTKVVRIAKQGKSDIIKLRENLGSPFEVPSNYEERSKTRRPAPKVEEVQ